MLFFTFIAGLAGNRRQQVHNRYDSAFSRPSKAVQIAVTVHETKKRGKRNLAFFSNTGKGSHVVVTFCRL
jgi:hypothetical protein